jgi:three-Cys-motif partner protein
VAAPRQTVWPLKPHTRAKHAILTRYLQAWIVILSQGEFPEILYIDGFAGPGEYKGGEAGSPIIALDTALEHNRRLKAKLHFLFVEKDDRRADHLRKQVASRTLPATFNVIVEGGVTFEAAFERRYPEFVRSGRLIPAFAFIDRFGWTGAPFDLVKQTQPSCEVYSRRERAAMAERAKSRSSLLTPPFALAALRRNSRRSARETSRPA